MIKKICTITLSMALLCLGSVAFAQNNQKRLSSVVSWDDSTAYGVDSIHYTWASGGEESIIFKNYPQWKETKFRSLPQEYKGEDLISFLHKTTESGYRLYGSNVDYEFYYKTEVNLNANGQIIEALVLGLNAQDVFKPFSRQLFTYDADHLSTQEMATTQDEGASWENLRKYNYTYVSGTDNLKRVIKEQGFLSNQWKNNSRRDIEYTGTQRTSEILSEWDDLTNNWDSLRIIEYSYSSAGLIDTMTDSKFYISGGATLTQPEERAIYNHAGNGFLMDVLEQSNQSGLGVINWRSNDSFTFAGNGNYITKTTGYRWDYQADEFVPRQKYEMSYAGPLLEYIKYFDWNEAQQNWVPGIYGTSSIFHYEDIDETGIHNIKDNLDFQLYPNPATNQITVTVNKENNIHSVRIVNVAGQLVFQNKTPLNAAKITIPVSQLSAGLYYLQIIGSDGNGVKSFVIK